MKGKKLLGGLLVGATMFAKTVPAVYAQTNYHQPTTDTEGQSIDTQYKTVEYTAPVEYYDIDISYDDLSWVLVYEGDIAEPDRSTWIRESYYNEHKDNVANLNSWYGDILNGDMLNQIDLDCYVPIAVNNNGDFVVDAQAQIVNKTDSNSDYTTAAGLKLAIDDLMTHERGQWQDGPVSGQVIPNKQEPRIFYVMPTATRFVNDSGETATVTGEVKLTFSKPN